MMKVVILMSKSFTKAVNGLINQAINDIHTALPAKVVRVNGMNIDVQPLVNLYKNGTFTMFLLCHQEL